MMAKFMARALTTFMSKISSITANFMIICSTVGALSARITAPSHLFTKETLNLEKNMAKVSMSMALITTITGTGPLIKNKDRAYIIMQMGCITESGIKTKNMERVL